MVLYPKIDVPKTFDEAVREYGEVVLSEKLSSSPTFNNADYVFHFEKIVCELKCLTEDNIHSPENRARTDQLLNDYYKRGLITSREINEENWSKWPRELFLWFVAVLVRPGCLTHLIVLGFGDAFLEHLRALASSLGIFIFSEGVCCLPSG